METLYLTKQCPNCNRWFTQQKSIRRHIRQSKRTIVDETETAANQLLSPGSCKSVFEGVASIIFEGGVDIGSTTVGEKGSSSLLDFDFNGGHNDCLYSELSNNDFDINRDVNKMGK
jgi:hypothetical protein